MKEIHIKVKIFKNSHKSTKKFSVKLKKKGYKVICKTGGKKVKRYLSFFQCYFSGLFRTSVQNI